MTIKLGQRVRDRMTGIEGIAIVRAEYLYGCTRIGVQPTEVKDGKPVDTSHFDEPQLEVIGDDFVVEAESSRPATGVPATGRHGDREAPSRPADPTR